MSIASVLATFSIEKAKDEDGREIEIDLAWTDGVVTFVELKCIIQSANLYSKVLLNHSAAPSFLEVRGLASWWRIPLTSRALGEKKNARTCR